jgi:hypothetical protein
MAQPLKVRLTTKNIRARFLEPMTVSLVTQKKKETKTTFKKYLFSYQNSRSKPVMTDTHLPHTRFPEEMQFLMHWFVLNDFFTLQSIGLFHPGGCTWLFYGKVRTELKNYYEERCFGGVFWWCLLCVCVSVYVCIFVNVYVYEYVCIYIYVCVYVCIWVCMYVCVYEYLCMCIGVYTCVYIYIYMYVCIYECVCECICMFVCVCVLFICHFLSDHLSLEDDSCGILLRFWLEMDLPFWW